MQPENRPDTEMPKALEGVVLDAEGNELTHPSHSSQNQYTEFRYSSAKPRGVFIWKSGNWFTMLLMIPAVIILLTVGLTLLAGFVVVGFVSWVVYKALRALFSPY